MKNTELTVGLFGTCDGISWRDDFMAMLDERGVNYFNPMVDDWHAGLVAEENRHLLEDDIILFPVLKESLGTGSLGEIGFSVLNAIRHTVGRTLIVYIDAACEPTKEYDPASIKGSVNARKLVKSKLMEHQSPSVIIVESLEEMQEACIAAVDLHKRYNVIRETFQKSA